MAKKSRSTPSKKEPEHPGDFDDNGTDVEKDIFDEDEDSDTPPKLYQDASEKPQDATGAIPVGGDDELHPEKGKTPLEATRVNTDETVAANQAILDRKGDLQPVMDQGKVPSVPGGQPQGSVKAVDADKRTEFLKKVYTNDPEALKSLESRTEGEPGRSAPGTQAFKVLRGMVGPYLEGSVIPDITLLGVKPRDLVRLLESDVIVPFDPE